MPTPEDFNELDEMLANLPVREPSQMLDARVASTLQATPRSRLPWLAIAAAVLLVGAVTLAIVFNPATSTLDTNPPITALPPDQPDDGPAILPVSASAEPVNLVWTRDVAEEVRYTPTGKPYRAVIREAVDHQYWTDPDTGAVLQSYTPREELIVIKQMTF